MQAATAFKLVIEDDEGARSVVPCELGEVSIGRYEDNTIRLDERNVSRHHARLIKSTEGVFAEDLDSYNGVWVNGERIEGRRELVTGDLIRIGDFVLELRGEALKAQREEITKRTDIVDVEEVTEPSITQVDIQAPQVQFDEGITDPGMSVIEAESPNAQPIEKTAIIRSEDYPGLGGDGAEEAQAIPGAKARLLVVSTESAGQEIVLSKTIITIGRTDQDNDVGLEHRSISRNHAKITCQNGVYKVLDLESANGIAVNGEAYVQCELKAGDLVELGHVKLRFIAPGQMYSPTEEEREALGGRSVEPLGGGEQTKVSGMGLGQLLGQRFVQIGLVGISVLGLGLIAFILLGKPDASDSRSETTIVNVAPTMAKNDGAKESDSAVIQAFLNKAKESLKVGDWSKALAYVEMALSEGAGAADVQAIVEQANKENKVKEIYDSALQAVEQGKWQEAWSWLQEVPGDSYYAAQAEALRQQIKETLVEELAAKAKDRLANKDWDGVSTLLGQIGEIDPKSSYLNDLQNAVSSEKDRQRAAAPKPKLRESSPRASNDKPKKKVAAAPKPPPTPSTADLREVAKNHYAEGKKLSAAKRHREALRRYSSCVKADKAYYPCYIGLGTSYGQLNEHDKTARYYKLYVKYAPDGAHKNQVLQWLRNYESR